MDMAIGIVVVGLLALLVVSLVWRWASRVRSLPCPSWAISSLENPYVRRFAGSERILDRMELSSGMRILDIGCGPGRVTIPAARRVGPDGGVIALDIQQRMLSHLRRRIEGVGRKNVWPIRADIGHSPLQENTFDRAMLVTVLGEIPDRRSALQGIFRALKPGGVLSVTELIPDPHYQSKRSVKRQCESAGFELGRAESRWLSFTMSFIKPDLAKVPVDSA